MGPERVEENAEKEPAENYAVDLRENPDVERGVERGVKRGVKRGVSQGVEEDKYIINL